MASRSNPPTAVTEHHVRRELRDFARRQERRHHLLPRAVLVGLLAGLVVVVFRRLLDLCDGWREELFRFAHGLPWGALRNRDP